MPVTPSAILGVAAALALAAVPAPAASPAPRLVAATAPTVLSADAEARWVPFTLTDGNQIRFAATLDDRPVVAILDTGVTHSVLARDYADTARIRWRPYGRAVAIGGLVDIGRAASVGRITIGGMSRARGGMTVAVLPAAAAGAGVDLLVGSDLLAGHALDIDYAARRFRLIPSGRLPFQGSSVPLTVRGPRPLYQAEVTLGGTRLRPMVVDTGDGAAITVTAAGWQAARMAAVTLSPARNLGIGGPAAAVSGIVPQLRIGAVAARDVTVTVEPPGGFSDSVGAAGRIGSGFLRDYRVLLDPGAGRMVLRAY